jgi:hypothetical protein
MMKLLSVVVVLLCTMPNLSHVLQGPSRAGLLKSEESRVTTFPSALIRIRAGGKKSKASTKVDKGAEEGVTVLDSYKKRDVLKVGEAISEDPSAVTMSPETMKKLDLFSGDTVHLKGKRRKDTIAVVSSDDSIAEDKILMNQKMRMNLRYDLHHRQNLIVSRSHIFTTLSTLDCALVIQWV